MVDSRKKTRRTRAEPLSPAQQCTFFGGARNPTENLGCPRPARVWEHGLVMCQLHYYAICSDPEDWSEEVRTPIKEKDARQAADPEAPGPTT